MPQFLIPPQNIQNNQFTLTGSDAHHLIRVLRSKVGDRHQFSDGAGRQFIGEIRYVDTSGPQLSGKIIREIKSEKPPIDFYLYQGLPKGAKWDYVIEKAAELGVGKIRPFLSQKNPVTWKTDGAASKMDRWKRLIESAVKQSGRSQRPEITLPQSLENMEGELSGGTLLVADPHPKSVELPKLLDSFNSLSSPVKLVIGPESGFSDSELAWLEKLGGHRFRWGNSIFRTETAGLVFISILKYALLK